MTTVWFCPSPWGQTGALSMEPPHALLSMDSVGRQDWALLWLPKHIIYFLLYLNVWYITMTCCMLHVALHTEISVQNLSSHCSSHWTSNASLPPPLLTSVQKASSQSLMMWKIHLNTQNNPLFNEQSAYFGLIILCHVVNLMSRTLTSMTQSPAVHCLCGCSVKVPEEIWYCWETAGGECEKLGHWT